MATASSITITYDGNDITSDVVYSSASFEQNAGAIPGQFAFRVKDINRTHSFDVGKEVTLSVDGQKLFGGIVLIVNRQFAMSVVDTTTIANVQERMWEISGSDYNIFFDKLVLHNTADYKNAIKTTYKYDGKIISEDLPNYLDVPSGVTFTHASSGGEVQNIRKLGSSKNNVWTFATQGATWRQVMEDMRVWTGATYFIDADKKVHWHPVGKTQNSWGLTDKPGNYLPTQMIPCREVSVAQDGGGMVTDALVWTGNQVFADSDSYQDEGGGLFFTRFPNPPANRKVIDGHEVWTKSEEQKGINKQNKWGRWQRAEQHFGEGNSPRLGGIRARDLVIGPTGAIADIDGGLGEPLWDVTATWFGHDVPGGNHCPAGFLMNLIFHALGVNGKPLVQFLPLRHTSISFPTIPENPTGEETYVKFIGRFGNSYSDHRKLWRVLRSGKRQINAYAASNAVASRYTEAENADPSAPPPSTGAFGQLSALEDPTDPEGKQYGVGHAYIPGTLRVYLNGLYQRPGIEYFENDPGIGEIQFYTALLDTDEVFIEFRAAGDTI